MNIIIRIWLLITCIALGLFYANGLLIKEKIKEKYPNAIFKMHSVTSFIMTTMQAILMCACPVIHIFVIYISIFNYENIMSRAVQRVEQSMKEEDTTNGT